jgi:hypothetical protein
MGNDRSSILASVMGVQFKSFIWCDFQNYVQGRDQWRVDVNSTVNLGFHKRRKILLTSWATVRISRITLCWVNFFPCSSFGIATGCGLDGWGIRVRFLAGETDFSLLRSIQTGSRAHPASCQMGTGVPRGEAARRVKLITHLHLMPRLRTVELYIHSPIRLHGVLLN